MGPCFSRFSIRVSDEPGRMIPLQGSKVAEWRWVFRSKCRASIGLVRVEPRLTATDILRTPPFFIVGCGKATTHAPQASSSKCHHWKTLRMWGRIPRQKNGLSRER